MLINHWSSLISVTFLLEELHTYTTCQVCDFQKASFRSCQTNISTYSISGWNKACIAKSDLISHVYVLDSPYNSDLLFS